jgi:hypothetical protein
MTADVARSAHDQDRHTIMLPRRAVALR